MEGTEAQWQRLSLLLRARMDEIGMTARGLSRASKRSPTHVLAVLAAKKTSYRDDSIYDLATAVGWTPASVNRILRGEDPELANGSAPAVTIAYSRDARIEQMSEAKRRRAERLVDAILEEIESEE